MNHYLINPHSPATSMQPLGIIIAIIFLVGWLLFSSYYVPYVYISRGKAMLVWLLGFILTLIMLCSTHPGHADALRLQAFLLPSLVLAFSIRLFQKFIGGHLTDAEKQPGKVGVRAWLSTGNVICAVLIPVCAWQSFNVSLPAMFMLTFGLLLVYPVFNLASAAPAPAPAAPVEDLTAAREKILQMLETGKINAEESAELLNALGQSTPARSPAPASETPLSPQRKIVLLGAALLLCSFFLPWFNINPSVVQNELSQILDAQIQQQPGISPILGPQMPALVTHLTGGDTVPVRAGNIAHGLGWWILALGIGAAVLPFFVTNLKALTQRKVILAMLVVGVFLLVYLLSDGVRFASLGILLALAGYVLEFIGTLKER